MTKKKKDQEKIPPCAASMGCLCAGHARGDDADAACDTREEPPPVKRAKKKGTTTVVVILEIDGDLEDAHYVVESVLDEGLFQESINGHDLDAGPLTVTSAMVWDGRGPTCPACGGGG